MIPARSSGGPALLAADPAELVAAGRHAGNAIKTQPRETGKNADRPILKRTII